MKADRGDQGQDTAPAGEGERAAEDVTASMRADGALHRYELLGSLTRDIVLIVRREDGRLLEANPAAVEAYGYGRERLLSLSIVDLRAPETRVLSAAQMAAADAHGLLFETVHRRVDGSTFDVEVSSRGSVVDGTPVLVSVIRDISERKRAEEALRASEEKFAAIYDHAPYAIALMRHPEGTLAAVNAAWERMFGFDRAEALGRTAVDLGLVPDLPGRTRMYAEVARTGSVRGFELAYATRAGERRLGAFSFERIEIGGRTFQLGTALDITERKRAEEALREADRRKDEFLAMLGHELRNPLAPIRNAASILERADPAGEQAERARGVLRRQSEHLTRLVDDLLDVTRITRGKIALQRARTSLRDVVLRAAEDIRPLMAERGISFRTDVSPAELWAHADATRLNQVVANLLHNASKFAHRGDEVTVSLRPEGSAAELRVRDTGAGIDPAVLPHVFEPFVQAEHTIARSEGGLGLGLALVKGIVELHGGEVRAESAGIGRGTEFVVHLPLREALEPGPGEARTPGAPAAGRRVLVVDDNRDAAESLADLLRMDGHDVEVAYDGPSALERLAAGTPEIVLCDIGLPGMDGYEVARAIRASGGRGLKLVALSGYAQAEDVRRAREAGFDAHVAKPPDVEELARLLA
jgi:PAS domain S-box-containing protein